MNLSKKKRATPKISVVIPTYNGMSTLGACMDSISRQELPRRYYEIIVVDDGSKEDVSNIAKKYGARFFRQKNNGPASARNSGAKKAVGQILAFTDDDCIADKNWLRMLLKKHGTGADAVGGLVLSVREDTLAEKFESLRKKILYGSKGKVFSKDKPGYLPTCNLSIKKESFWRNGGFDTTFRFPSGEDTDFCYRLCRNGGSIRYFPDAVVFHQHPASIKGVLKRQYLHARENVILFRKNFGNLAVLKTTFGYLPAFFTMLALPLSWFGFRYLLLCIPFMVLFLALPFAHYRKNFAGLPILVGIQLMLLVYLAQATQAAGHAAGLLKYSKILLQGRRYARTSALT